MNLMMLAFDVFFSALEFATSDRAGTDFSANEECRLILGNLAETIVRRLGENNRHMFKQSGKALVFLSRQGKPLQGRRWVAKAILKPVPNVHELSQNRQATLAVRGTVEHFRKKFARRNRFHHARKLRRWFRDRRPYPPIAAPRISGERRERLRVCHPHVQTKL